MRKRREIRRVRIRGTLVEGRRSVRRSDSQLMPLLQGVQNIGRFPSCILLLLEYLICERNQDSTIEIHKPRYERMSTSGSRSPNTRRASRKIEAV
jgi:hypothetical protein